MKITDHLRKLDHLWNKINSRKRKSIIYTDTPEKENVMQHKTKYHSTKMVIKKTKKLKITKKNWKGKVKNTPQITKIVTKVKLTE